MASQDNLKIIVRGRQTHGAAPWNGIDPIVVASQIIMGLQTIPSRQVSALSPCVVTIGTIQAGVLSTINSGRSGHDRHHPGPGGRRGPGHPWAGGAHGPNASPRAPGPGPRCASSRSFRSPPTTRRSLRAWSPPCGAWPGEGRYREALPLLGSEDFSFYVDGIPGMYFFLGVNAEGVGEGVADSLHSPRFFVNEDALVTGMRAMAHLALDYLATTG